MPRSPAYAAVLGLAALCYVALGVVLPALPGHVAGDLHAGTIAVAAAARVGRRLWSCAPRGGRGVMAAA